MQRGKVSFGGRWPAAAVAAVAASLVLFPVPAAAEDDDPEPGEHLCDPGPEGLADLSGLVVDDDGGYFAIHDSTQFMVTEISVYPLNENCEDGAPIVGQVDPADPQDLAFTSEGDFWVADIGDVSAARETVAFHHVPAEGGATERYRMTYPDGAKHAEALLLQPDGTPVIATKEAGGATLYAPADELQPGVEEGQALEEVGSVDLEESSTPGGPSDEDPNQVTGAAVSADGDRAVLRTYTDAYEWEVSDGDVVAALTSDTEPTVTPLPDEPEGTAIAYTADGEFVTGSKGEADDAGVPAASSLRAYEPVVPDSSDDEAGDDEAADDEAGPQQSLTDRILDTLGAQGILRSIGAVALLGLLMVVLGVTVIVRARRRAAAQTDEDEEAQRLDYDEYDDDVDEADFRPRGDRRHDDDYEPRRDERAGAVYGGRNDREEAGSGSVYGGRDDREEAGTGSVYGGRGSGRAGSAYGGDEDDTGTVYGGRNRFR